MTRNASRIKRFGSCRVLGCIADDVILAGSVEIWLDHDEISPNLVKFGLDLDGILSDLIEILLDLVRSGLDLDEISSDLIRSDGISSNLCQRTPNTDGFCKFSLKILQISLEVFGF